MSCSASFDDSTSPIWRSSKGRISKGSRAVGIISINEWQRIMDVHGFFWCCWIGYEGSCDSSLIRCSFYLIFFEHWWSDLFPLLLLITFLTFPSILDKYLYCSKDYVASRKRNYVIGNCGRHRIIFIIECQCHKLLSLSSLLLSSLTAEKRDGNDRIHSIHHT